MNTGGKVPNAWDDDWVENVETSPAQTEAAPTNKKLSQAEKRARQAEFNRELWNNADNTTDSYYIQTRDIVPLKSDFRPTMQVLSRKPPKPTNISESGQQLGIDDEDIDDEVGKDKQAMSSEERQAKAQKEREEKQRKYEEVRQRLFGADKVAQKKASGVVTPPRQISGDSRRQSRNRGNGDPHPASSAGVKARQLYDPNYTAKPDSAFVQKTDGQEMPGPSMPNEQVPIRYPKGPDGSGRGGFGFAPRQNR